MELQTKENSIQELKNENVEKEERILTKKDVTKSWWLWWLSVEVANSFERLQALACCISMIPILRKLYKNEDDFRAGLKRHLQFLTQKVHGELLHWELQSQWKSRKRWENKFRMKRSTV